MREDSLDGDGEMMCLPKWWISWMIGYSSTSAVGLLSDSCFNNAKTWVTALTWDRVRVRLWNGR